jgi:hypothetical protein
VVFQTIYLLTEMHIRAYKAQRINRGPGLYFSADDGGCFCRKDGRKESQAITSEQVLFIQALL